jgi:hypothetical protein
VTVEARVAKVDSTQLGFWDDGSGGTLTAWLHLDYGGASQGAGGWNLVEGRCATWVRGVLGACGVTRWERVAGRTVYALVEDGYVVGLRPLPTEPGEEFRFEELK